MLRPPKQQVWGWVLGSAAALVVIVGGVGGFAAAPHKPQTAVAPAQPYGALPLLFEARSAGRQAQYVARGPGYALSLSPGGADLHLAGDPGAALHMEWEGGAAVAGQGVDLQSTRIHDLRGRDPAAWRENIPAYARVRYAQVYPGIDLVFYGRQRELEYDFVVAPGADPSQITLRFTGADALTVDAGGDVWLHTPAGRLRQHHPHIYQPTAGGPRVIEGGYVSKGGGRIGFQLAAYDPGLPLVIDPVLDYSTYLGGSGNDIARAIALDSTGRAYVTGTTLSPAFAGATGARGLEDAFVTRLNASGTAVDYVTYLGGATTDEGWGIAVDGADNAYITGVTRSADFPTTTGAFQRGFGGQSDAFIVKLNTSGGIAYATYLGGTDIDVARALALDASGHVYVTGYTWSDDFPVRNPYQGTRKGTEDVFVAKLDTAGASDADLIYATYIGAGNGDIAQAIGVDSAGRAYVGGYTYSPDFPTRNSDRPSHPISIDAFVAAFDASGSGLLYSTFLGGGGDDEVRAVTIDASDHAWVAGTTTSRDFPLAAARQGEFGGAPSDAFLSRLDYAGAGLVELVYSSYLGGSGADTASGLALGAGGDIYVAGATRAADFPVLKAVQPERRGDEDAFIARFRAADAAPLYATYLGGGANDSAAAIAVDATGRAYIAGVTTSTDLPVAQPSLAGQQDVFLARIDPAGISSDIALVLSGAPDPALVGATLIYEAVITNRGPDDASGVHLQMALPAGVGFTAADPDQGTCVHAAGVVDCDLGGLAANAATTVQIRVLPQVEGTQRVTARAAATEPDILTTNNTAEVQTETTTAAPTSTGGHGGGALGPALGLLAAAWWRRRHRATG